MPEFDLPLAEIGFGDLRDFKVSTKPPEARNLAIASSCIERATSLGTGANSLSARFISIPLLLCLYYSTNRSFGQAITRGEGGVLVRAVDKTRKRC